MFDQRPVRDIAGRDLESIHSQIVEKVGTFFVERGRQKLDSKPVGFFVQRFEGVVRQLKLLEEFLKVRLVFRVRQSRRTRRSQAVRLERLEFDCICSRPLRGADECQGPLLISTMVEACFRNHINALGIIC